MSNGEVYGRWEGRMRHKVVHGAMERARKGHGAVWDDGEGTEGMV